MKTATHCWIVCILIALTMSEGFSQTSSNIKSNVLTLDQAVDMGLKNHPSLQIANAGLDIASSGVTQNVSNYYPSISANGSLARNDGTFALNIPGFPVISQRYNIYTGAVQVNETIFDFGRTINKVSASHQLVDAALASFDSTRQTIILNVKLAYYGYMQQQQVVSVNQEAVEQTSQHLKEAKAFYSVGKVAQLDVTRAEVDYANAQVGLIVAKNQLQLAKLQLDNAMGILSSSQYAVQDTFEIPPFSMTLDSAEAVMESVRPDLVAAKARVEASLALVNAAWDQNLPTISANGTYTWSNFNFPLVSHWNAGLTVTLPLFQGFSVTAQVDQARAGTDAAKAGLELLRESMILEIEQNYLGVQQAEDRIAATSKLVEEAEESMRLAERQYVAGVGSAIEVTDAQLSLSNARITRIQALSDYNSFLVRLQRSMGVLSEH